MTRAKTPFWIGAALTLGLALARDSISDPLQREIVQDKPLGKFSVVGDYAGQAIPNALYVIGMLGDYVLNDRSTSLDRAWLMTKAFAYSGITTVALKYTVRESRPNRPGNKTSFPSGHTSTAFAFASVVGAEHALPYGIAAYALATLVGLSRMNDNQHVLHDVVGGATIGLSYGLGLYYRKKHKLENISFQFLPSDHLDGAMFIAELKF